MLVFHYSGCWGSDGDYSLAHNLEDAATSLDWLLADEVHRIDKTRIYAVGHSLGGFVCAQMVAGRPEIQAGVLLMPCDIGRLPEIAAGNPQAAERICQVLRDSAQWLTGTSGRVLWEEAISHSQEFRLESLAERLAQKPLLCVSGILDMDTPPEYHCKPLEQAIQRRGGTKLRSIGFPTDHFFSDHRETVSRAVTEFLLKQLQSGE